MIRMKRNKWSRRFLFVVCLAVGPMTTACEAILDFDRTPLQPVPEASVRDDASSVPDVRPDRGSSSGEVPDANKPDTSGPATSDAGDAGKDGDAN